MRISKSHTSLCVLFVVTQIGAGAGCNAILGNGYGVDDFTGTDGAPSTDDGSTAGDALGDGTTSTDGMITMDGGSSDGPLSGDGSVIDGGCPDNVCPTKLTSAIGPQQLAVSATSVYYTRVSGISVVAVDGGTAKDLALAGFAAVPLTRGVAVGPTGIPYVTLPGAGRGAAECTLNLSDCANTFIGSAGSVSSITTDAANVYIGINDDLTPTHGGGIDRTALDGTGFAPYVGMTDNVLDVQIAGTTTYFRTAGGIFSNTISATTPVSAANLGTDVPVTFAVHAGTLVIGAKTAMPPANNTIRMCALAASCNAVIVQNTVATPTSVIADGNYIYWAEGTTSGSIHRCDFNGCLNPKVIAVGQATPLDLALDTQFVYWTNYGGGVTADGTIMKHPR